MIDDGRWKRGFEAVNCVEEGDVGWAIVNNCEIIRIKLNNVNGIQRIPTQTCRRIISLSY